MFSQSILISFQMTFYNCKKKKKKNQFVFYTNLSMPMTSETSHSFQSSLTVEVNFPRNSMINIYIMRCNKMITSKNMENELPVQRVVRCILSYLKYKGSTNYSREEGILGWPCKHVEFVWFAGIELIAYL